MKHSKNPNHVFAVQIAKIVRAELKKRIITERFFIHIGRHSTNGKPLWRLNESVHIRWKGDTSLAKAKSVVEKAIRMTPFCFDNSDVRIQLEVYITKCEQSDILSVNRSVDKNTIRSK